MASLSKVSQGKILVNQKSHYEKIMIREKDMNFELAKNLVESLIFSAEQPLSKTEIKKILLEHGQFDIDKILEELKMIIK